MIFGIYVKLNYLVNGDLLLMVHGSEIDSDKLRLNWPSSAQTGIGLYFNSLLIWFGRIGWMDLFVSVLLNRFDFLKPIVSFRYHSDPVDGRRMGNNGTSYNRQRRSK